MMSGCVQELFSEVQCIPSNVGRGCDRISFGYWVVSEPLAQKDETTPSDQEKAAPGAWGLYGPVYMTVEWWLSPATWWILEVILGQE